MSISAGGVSDGTRGIVFAMSKLTQAVGAYGERVATRCLVENGLVVLDRNWRSATGEIDIVARDGDVLVICEVRTRRARLFGTPAESVVHSKVRRLRRLAAEWLAANGVRPSEVRFDLVEVYPSRRGAPRTVHLQAAF